MTMFPGKVKGHVEVFKRGPNGEEVLVHTSRPCDKCGGPLEGVVIPKGKTQQHLVCPTR
jgi:hypothetical protein